MNKIVALASAKVTTFVPTKNADRARTFYEGTLGLAFRGDDSFALIFDLNGTSLRIVRVENFTPAPFTVLGWDVVDIAPTAKQLRDSGVTFQKYPGLEQDENSVWTSPNGTKVAWFKDPDGNVLSISQAG
ncbi:MAG: VOC family protein [Acidobacteriaceae bacterium]|jgi:catechol 2,3-dioxygenase-like lactoylglutathione lyase family enzyme